MVTMIRETKLLGTMVLKPLETAEGCPEKLCGIALPTAGKSMPQSGDGAQSL